ncbi:M16 family metallopeptidase [Chitinophaga oryzae]|nr:M16 family metallopeptidase [Chitinophaga oryzae]
MTNAQKNDKWKIATAGGYTYKYVPDDPMKARFYKLNNGLTVILSVNKKSPRIQTLIGTRAGSNNDPRAHTGLAHYLEHLLFKGTDKFGTLDWAKEKPLIEQITRLYDKYNKTTDPSTRKAIYREIDSVSGIAAKYAIPNEYDKMMADIGAQATNAHTAVEETIYEEDIPSNAVDKYLAIQAERFRAPVFRLFHTELEAVYEEKNRLMDDDGFKGYESMLTALFPRHNYGQQSLIGTTEHLKNPNLRAIRQFYNEYYVPNNMAIVMAGDFDPDHVIKSIDEKFAYMKARAVKEYKPVPEAPIKAPIEKNVFGPAEESIDIAFRVPGALDTKSKLLLNILSSILDNSKTGLLDLNINKKQAALKANAEIIHMKDYSILILSGRAKLGQTLDEVKALLLDQLAILKKGDFDTSLLKAIVNNAKLNRLERLESNNNRATELMEEFIISRSQNWADEVAYIDDMQTVTKQQLVDYANKYIKDNYVIVYKRKGEDKNIQKVEKPAITPIVINREAVTAFRQEISAIPVAPVKPQWLDFQKDIQKTSLGNTDLLYVQNKDNGLFRLHYRFDFGNQNDKKLSLAAQYLEFLGTDKYTVEQINKEFYEIACNFRINIDNKSTTITISGLQENFDRAVALFEHVIANCKPNEEALAVMKNRIQKIRSDNKQDKKAIRTGIINYALYGSRNPFNDVLSQTDIDGITATELTDILHQLPMHQHSVLYWGPQPMSAVATDIKKLHTLPATFKIAPVAVNFPKVNQEKNQVLFVDYDMVQTEVLWLRNLDTYDPSKTGHSLVFNKYFGGDMGSILFQTLRESKALAYATFGSVASPDKKDDRYSAITYIGSQADKMNEAIVGMNQLLTDIPRDDNSLEIAKKAIKQDIETERITDDGIIFRYLAAQKLGLNTDIRKQAYETIDKISFDDIKKLHDDWLSHKSYTYGVLASDKKVSPEDLKKYGDVKQLTLEEIFGY